MAGRSRKYRFYRLAWQVLDWILPPRCVGCGKPGTRWCEDCLEKVPLVGNKVCQKCGLPLSRGSLCAHCRLDPPRYVVLRSWARYEDPARKVIRRLKYNRDLALGDSLAELMEPVLRCLAWPVQQIVPVPLARKRQIERGYNQAGLIARPLALALDLPYLPKALTRWRETRSQVGLTREQRRENTRDAFRALREDVRGRNILLIDDVATTGSTLSSAAEALLAAGAEQVYAFTAARAVWTSSHAEAGGL